ncbi:unnamed protein product [Prunus armeniaca]
MEFRPPVGLLIPGRGFWFENPAYQPTIPRLDCLPRGDSAKILVGCLGFLVNGPGIGEMSATIRGPPRFGEKFRGGSCQLGIRALGSFSFNFCAFAALLIE